MKTKLLLLGGALFLVIATVLFVTNSQDKTEPVVQILPFDKNRPLSGEIIEEKTEVVDFVYPDCVEFKVKISYEVSSQDFRVSNIEVLNIKSDQSCNSSSIRIQTFNNVEVLKNIPIDVYVGCTWMLKSSTPEVERIYLTKNGTENYKEE